jgi:hypothetical protein
MFDDQLPLRDEAVDDSVGDRAPFDAQVVQFFQFFTLFRAFENQLVVDFGQGGQLVTAVKIGLDADSADNVNLQPPRRAGRQSCHA